MWTEEVPCSHLQDSFTADLQCLWEDATGTTHIVHQGEGGEQRDPLMPLLHSVGQHRTLEAISRELLASEKLLAHLDDIHVITRPDRVGGVYTAFRQNLWIHACVSINNGKTKVWNAAGHKPAVWEVLDRVAQAEDPDARVWRGSEVATERQGLLLMRSPFGHPHFVVAQLQKIQRNMSGSHHTSQACPVGPLRERTGKLFAESGPSRLGCRVCETIVVVFVPHLGDCRGHV